MQELKSNIHTSINRNGQDDTIDLAEVFRLCLNRWYQIVLSFLVVAILFNSYAYLLIKPTYSATAKLYIVSASEDTLVNLSDLHLGQSLTADYEELLLTYSVLEQVIERLDLDMDYKQLAKMIQLTNPTDTRVLNISVTATDSKLAMEIANTLAEVAVDYLPETMNTLKPNIAQRAREEHTKIAPSYARYTMMGGILGAVICCGVLIIGSMMDDRIYTQEQIKELFDMIPLAVIPESDGADSEKSIKRKKVFGRRGKKK